MKEVKYSAVGSSSSSSVEVAGNVITRFWNPKLPHHFNAGLVTVAVVSFMMVLHIRDSLNSGLLDDFKRMIYPLNPPEEVEMPQRWNHSSHEFLPVISDWDEQRVRWIEGDPNFKVEQGARPRVLMVTGSSEEESELSILSHLLLRAGKNKQDYSHMHDIELYYNMMNPDPEFSDWWVKLPVIRILMLRHPEVEWIWWLDADQVITDMTFEPSFTTLEQFNLVLYGEYDRLLNGSSDPKTLDPKMLSTGNLMIRNCQWSLDFLGAWAHKGTESTREEAGSGEFQEKTGANGNVAIVAGDDHASLVALFAEDMRNPLLHQKWVPNVKLVEETEYTLNGNWTHIAPRLEELGQDSDHRVPFVTHFDGCLPHPAEVPKLSRQDSENFRSCVEQLERAFDFAENQVYKELGLERTTIGNSTAPFIWKDTPQDESAETSLRILPIVTDWDEKRKAYMESKPWTKKDQAVILSGSRPTPVEEKGRAHLLVRGLKNKIDYSHRHGIRMFYNMAVIHKNLTGWWSKLPALKLMMINSVDVEWIWWTDSDAVFTSMDFEPPFERYNANGFNLIMYGDEHDVFDLKKYNAINTGDMFIRNCQWSLDLLDKWASLANMKVDFIDNFLDRPEFSLDDQSVLVYLLITEREKWASKLFLENDGAVVMSGEWQYWTELFVDEYKMRSDQMPVMTHFAGCHADNSVLGLGFGYCYERYDRAFNFADNQLLKSYGLRHERLNSSHVVGDSLGDQQEWTNLEIERLIGKSPEKLSPAAKEEATTSSEEDEKSNITKAEEAITSPKEEKKSDATKEDVASTSPKLGSKEEEKSDTTKQEEVSISSKEEKLDTSKEQEVTTGKEEEKVDTTKEHEEAPQTKEEKIPVAKDGEEVAKTKDEKVDSKNEEKKVEPTEEQAEVTTTKDEEKVDPSVEKSANSELGDEIPANTEAPKEVEVETKKEEKVDRPEDSQTSKGNSEEKVAHPEEESNQSQTEQEKPAEERGDPQENLSTPAEDKSSRVTDP